MKLVDILNGEPGRYKLVVPSCDPAFPAYAAWEGVIVRKSSTNSVRVENPMHTNYQVGELLRLNGIVTKSEWVFLGGYENG